MTRNIPTRSNERHNEEAVKQSPEDSSMKNGLFQEYNTEAPSSTSVQTLFSLKHKTAIISGGDRGIGLNVANALAEAGANVAIWFNSNQKAHDRAAEIAKRYGVRSKAYQCNVTDPSAVEKAVKSVVDDFDGRLDIFVANAGVPWTQGRMIDGDLDHYKKVTTIDFDGVFYCARAAGAVWRRQYETGVNAYGEKLQNYRAGSFIATASMSGHIVNIPQLQAAVSSLHYQRLEMIANAFQYNASKAGVIHMCKSLAVEWVKFARVNTISPGYVATEISDFIPPETKAIWRSKTPMGRECEPHELKGAYLYLASDASSFTTGTDIIIDGGYSIV